MTDTGEKSLWIRGSALVQKQFATPTWILPDMLPDVGAYLLSAKPKAGKSWLALTVAMAVAQAGFCLGRNVAGGRVLYLALEDTPRRLQSRILKLQPDTAGNPSALSGIAFATEFPRLGTGAESALAGALKAGGVRLVVVDTLQKIRPLGGSATQYEADYQAISALKRLADTFGVCVLVIHHTRKMDSDDIHDSVSGTLGLTGAADGSLVLVRQRGDGGATLSVTGRDMPEAEFGLRFDAGFWSFAGTAAEVKATSEQREILEVLRPYGADGATTADICKETGKQNAAARSLLRKLQDAGQVRCKESMKPPRWVANPPPVSVSGAYSTDEEREKRERGEREEGEKTTYGAYSTYGAYGAYGAYGQAQGRAVSGVSLDADSSEPAESRLNTGETVRAVSGVSGVSGSDTAEF